MLDVAPHIDHLVSANQCVVCGREVRQRAGDEGKAAAEAAEYLVVVQVVGKTSDEELVRGIWNDGGDDACGDDKQQNEIVAFQLGDT